MIPIPPYLQQHATFLKGNDTEVRFSISCTCGNPRLEVWQNCLSEAEQAEAAIFEKACKKLACGPWGATSIPDENGHLHHWKFLTPFGMKGLKKEIILPPAPIGSLIGVIQCKCPQCGKEFTLFDSRYHGYDAVFNPPSQDTLQYLPQFRLLRRSCHLEASVTNDSVEYLDDNHFENYANGFDWINIFAVSEKGKRTTIFGWETA